MTETAAEDPGTPGLLLDALRQATGLSGLRYAAPPQRLTGGFYAEMFRFALVDAPAALDRDLVARIIPNPPAGAWEAAIQAAVADQGFPTPAVRLQVPESNPLGRYLLVMDAVDGQPPMAGLGFATIFRQIPDLVRHLPVQMARIAADLHRLDAGPLAAQLDALDTAIPTTTAGFVADQTGHAVALGRSDLVGAGERLLATEPPSPHRVIAHGDLHPFNLLIAADGPWLVDWTVARVAHPAFTIGFTDLILTNPPLPIPRVGAAALRPVVGHMAKRFLATYRHLTVGTRAEVDDEQLDWHRKVHALRILVELAGWQADESHDATGHPWVVIEPVARRTLGI